MLLTQCKNSYLVLWHVLRMFRFGNESVENIKQEIQNLTPRNTKKNKESVWKQFIEFCTEKSYDIENSSIEQLANILEDYAFNMKKRDGGDYKESVVKLMWNVTAKQLQEMMFTKFKIKFNPFSDIEFTEARSARDAKRRKLQTDPSKRKASSAALSNEEYNSILNMWDEDTPEGLQRKFFHVSSRELAWRGGEGCSASVKYFVEEKDSKGGFTGRIEYNPLFSKTTQGGAKKLADSKWLITNSSKPEVCPVRLFQKLIQKRGDTVTTDRLFLTANPNWKHPQ